MQNYIPGTAVTVYFPLADESGTALLPTSLRWRVLDEASAPLNAWVDLDPLTVSDPVEVVVGSTYTTLAGGALRGIRMVEMQVVTETGAYPLVQSFLLQASTRLSVPLNSWQTYNQALLLADEFIVPAWDMATRDQREKAMVVAHAAISRLAIYPEYDDAQDRISDALGYYTRLSEMTANQYAVLDAKMVRAICQAQLVEADYLLNPDPVVAARREGLTSMTTGESSQTFRSDSPALDFGICKRAYEYLAKYVRQSIRIGRA